MFLFIIIERSQRREIVVQPVSAFKNFENINKKPINKEKKEKKVDPLSHFPLRFCAYANEIGAALSPINPTLGTTLWAPALMYFGADIYDKYKNDNNTYNPSTTRGFEQAVFQTLSSIILPTTAIRIGQKIGAHVIPWNKSDLSPDVQKELIDFTRNSIKENRLSDNTPESLKEILKRNFKNKMNNIAPEVVNESPIKKFKKLMFETQDPVHSLHANQKKLMSFIDDKVDEMYQIRKNLLRGEITTKTPEKLHKHFRKQISKLQGRYPTNFEYKAAKSTIMKKLKIESFKLNIPATIGGFVALAIAAKPIDKFSESIIEKFIRPGLSNFEKHPKKES